MHWVSFFTPCTASHSHLGPPLSGRDPTGTGGGGQDRQAHVSQEATDSVSSSGTVK